jgi:hypothetical protein
VLMMIVALAETPGRKLQETLGAEVGSLFLLAFAGFALYFFVQRAFTKFITFVLFALLVSVFIFTPQLVQSLGANGFDWLFGGLVN